MFVNLELVENKLEKVWLKYICLVCGCKCFYILNGCNKFDGVEDYIDDELSLIEED